MSGADAARSGEHRAVGVVSERVDGAGRGCHSRRRRRRRRSRRSAGAIATTALAALASLATLAATARADAIGLPELLRAASRHHPELVAARAKVDAQRGKLLSRHGAFDPKLGVSAGTAPVGMKSEHVAGVGVRQQTAVAGVRWKAGWRYGADHPVYAGKAVTAGGGDVYGQVGVPLWRGRAIDDDRAALARAELEVQAAEQRLRAKAIEVLEKAGQAWVKWRVALAKERIAAELLALAERRAAQLEGRVRRGLVADLVRVDNERLLASRRGGLTAAREASARAALTLSLFWRDADGAPREVSAASAPIGDAPTLPIDVGTGASAGVDEIKAATTTRPEPRVAALAAAAAEIDLALAANDGAPQLDLLLDAAWGLGEGGPYGDSYQSQAGAKASAQVALAWPWPRRKARGNAAAARANIRAAEAMARLWRDRVGVEVKIAHVALDAARDRLRFANQAARAAHELEQAEWRRFDLGQVDLVVVNLREVATATAADKAATAWGDLHRARLRVMAANGTLADWAAAPPAAPQPTSVPATTPAPTATAVPTTTPAKPASAGGSR